MTGTPAGPERPSTTVPLTGSLAAALMEEAQRAAVAGRRQVARQRYEGALYLLKGADESTAASTILRRVGRTYLDDGDVEAGLDCLMAAHAVAIACDNPGEVAHTVNVMAVSHVQRGDLDEGERLYEEAGLLARVAGEERLIAMVEQNLGVIASMHGEVPAALTHYHDSLRRYRALGLIEDVARLLNNIGMAHAKLRDWSDAELTYLESSALAKQCGDDWTRLMVEVNRVALLIDRSDFAQAKRIADEILGEASALQEKRLLAETYKHCGIIARETGHMEEAESYLRMAYAEALERQDSLLAAETSREQADLFLRLGRNREALQRLSQAHRLFSNLRATQDLRDVSARLRSLESQFHAAVRIWAQTIESKDAYTHGHCERVADYACAIATDMGFDETSLFWFRVGALLHDVGKIVVQSDILNKPGPLTPEERRIMERHPVAGVELLADVDFPWDVLPMIRGHHERWDGHGYPDALSGEAIPLTARILCVADVYDALTSQRPYRRAFESRDALRLMQADTGRMFDPEILTRFFKLVMNENAGGASLAPPAFLARGFDLEVPVGVRL